MTYNWIKGTGTTSDTAAPGSVFTGDNELAPPSNPLTIAAVASQGAANTAARSDHVHDGVGQIVAGTGVQVTAQKGVITISADFSSSAFSGIVRKNHNPASTDYSPGTTSLITYDIGAFGQLIPLKTRLPPLTSVDVFGRIEYEFNDGTITGSNNNSVLELIQDISGIIDVITGDMSEDGANNGLRVRKLKFQVVNNTGGTASAQNFDVFRVSAIATPIGSGAAL